MWEAAAFVSGTAPRRLCWGALGAGPGGCALRPLLLPLNFTLGSSLADDKLLFD